MSITTFRPRRRFWPAVSQKTPPFGDGRFLAIGDAANRNQAMRRISWWFAAEKRLKIRNAAPTLYKSRLLQTGHISGGGALAGAGL
jgi:hypothetical protein